MIAPATLTWGDEPVLKIHCMAAALVLTATTQAYAGNYETGVRIGSHPTAAQQAFYDDQMRIRYQGEFLHESEHRNGGKLVLKVTKEVWGKVKATVQEKRREWLPAPTYHRKRYH